MYLVFLYAYFTWLALQNFLLPLAYQQGWLSFVSAGALLAAKEVVMVLALFALGYRAFRKGWRFNVADKCAMGYAILLGLYLGFAPFLLGTSVSFFIRLVSLRSLISLVLFYFWGRLSFLELGEMRRFIRFVLVLQLLVALFGIVEWTVLPLSFWSDTVGQGAFMTDVKGLPEGINVTDGLPSNMVRSDIRRSISTYGDPLAMSVACVFPLLLCAGWMLKSEKIRAAAIRWKWWIAAVIIGLALLLTNGRESIAVALMGVVLLGFWAGKGKSVLVPVVAAGLLVLAIPAVWSHIQDTISFREGSASLHLQFLQVGWEKAPSLLLGKGLGEAGGWAGSLAGADAGVGEDTYLELMAQAGLLSVVLLIGFLLAIYKHARWLSLKIPDKLISTALAAAAANIAGRMIMAVFSPSFFDVVPMASFFFLCGAMFTTAQRLGLKPGWVLRKAVVFNGPGARNIGQGLLGAVRPLPAPGHGEA